MLLTLRHYEVAVPHTHRLRSSSSLFIRNEAVTRPGIEARRVGKQTAFPTLWGVNLCAIAALAQDFPRNRRHRTGVSETSDGPDAML